MKKLNIYIYILVFSILSLTLASCKPISGKNIAVQTSEEIMRCFNEEDVEGLKSMFFANELPTNNLDKQIKEAFEFYDGPSVSYDLPNAFGEEKSVRDGEIKRWDMYPIIENIETDGNITYLISCHMYIIYDGQETKKITRLTIFNQDNLDECYEIGKYFY